jgi:hypothetical protein
MGENLNDVGVVAVSSSTTTPFCPVWQSVNASGLIRQVIMNIEFAIKEDMLSVFPEEVRGEFTTPFSGLDVPKLNGVEVWDLIKRLQADGLIEKFLKAYKTRRASGPVSSSMASSDSSPALVLTSMTDLRKVLESFKKAKSTFIEVAHPTMALNGEIVDAGYCINLVKSITAPDSEKSMITSAIEDLNKIRTVDTSQHDEGDGEEGFLRRF